MRNDFAKLAKKNVIFVMHISYAILVKFLKNTSQIPRNESVFSNRRRFPTLIKFHTQNRNTLNIPNTYKD